jgi:hypothetical protein
VLEDCLVASFGSTSEHCAQDSDCNVGSLDPHGEVCMSTSLGDNYCVIVGTADLRCEDLPNHPRLQTSVGTDVDGHSNGYCAVITNTLCGSDGFCTGPSWPNP